MYASKISEEFIIRREVRQGGILSPLLFNVYSEHLFKKALKNMNDELIINAKIIHNLRFADDTVFKANTAEGL